VKKSRGRISDYSDAFTGGRGWKVAIRTECNQSQDFLTVLVTYDDRARGHSSLRIIGLSQIKTTAFNSFQSLNAAVYTRVSSSFTNLLYAFLINLVLNSNLLCDLVLKVLAKSLLSKKFSQKTFSLEDTF